MLGDDVRATLSSVRQFYEALAELEGVDLAHALEAQFGATFHGFLLRPRTPSAEVEAFEGALQSRLPDDYRHFLLEIGNGGAGPSYGLFSLGYQCEDPAPDRPWREWDSWEMERLREPFHPDWQGLAYSGSVCEDEDLRETIEESCPPGAIAISHRGCAEYDYLILNGPHRGEIWAGAFDPYPSGPSGASMSFDDWYSAWLGTVVAAVRATPAGRNWRMR